MICRRISVYCFGDRINSTETVKYGCGHDEEEEQPYCESSQASHNQKKISRKIKITQIVVNSANMNANLTSVICGLP